VDECVSKIMPKSPKKTTKKGAGAGGTVAGRKRRVRDTAHAKRAGYITFFPSTAFICLDGTATPGATGQSPPLGQQSLNTQGASGCGDEGQDPNRNLGGSTSGRREEKVSFVDRIAAISPRRAGSTSAPAHSVSVKNGGVSAGPVSLRTLNEDDDEILDLTGEDGDEILDLTGDPDREIQVMGKVNEGNAASDKDVPSLDTIVRESASTSPIMEGGCGRSSGRDNIHTEGSCGDNVVLGSFAGDVRGETENLGTESSGRRVLSPLQPRALKGGSNRDMYPAAIHYPHRRSDMGARDGTGGSRRRTKFLW